MGNTKLDQALDIVAEFIIAVKESKPITGKHGLTNQVIFSHHEEGALILADEEARQYRMCLRQLMEVAASDERISRKAVEHLLQKAILASLDMKNRRSNLSFQERLDDAISNLEIALKRDPIEFQIFYPIGGLDLEGLPTKVGKVNLCVFDDAEYTKFREIIEAAEVADEERHHRTETFDSAANKLMGMPIGVVEVLALDEEAAFSLAIKELRLTIDAINFYSDVIHYSNRYAFLPGDTDPNSVVNLILVPGDKPKFHIQGKRVGPLASLTICKNGEAH